MDRCHQCLAPADRIFDVLVDGYQRLHACSKACQFDLVGDLLADAIAYPSRDRDLEASCV